METTPKNGRERRRRRRGLLALLMSAAAIGSATTAALSLALFTSSVTVGANAFTTGTIHIGAAPATALLTSSLLMPGDNVTGDLTVSNTGTAALQYHMTSAPVGGDPAGLLTTMTLTVKTLGTTCAAFDGTTTIVNAQPLGTASFGSAPHVNWRTLAGGASEHLCFRATLPLAAGDALQGATATVAFTFPAEQVANNP